MRIGPRPCGRRVTDTVTDRLDAAAYQAFAESLRAILATFERHSGGGVAGGPT